MAAPASAPTVGFDLDELKDTWICKCNISLKQWDKFIQPVCDSISMKHALNHPQVNDGLLLEEVPHITVAMKLPRGILTQDEKNRIRPRLESHGRKRLLEARPEKLVVFHSVREVTPKNNDEDKSKKEKIEFDILAMEMKVSPELIAIHEELSHMFDVKWPYERYIPHITIAFLKPGTGERYRTLELGDHMKSQVFDLDRLVFQPFQDRAASHTELSFFSITDSPKSPTPQQDLDDAKDEKEEETEEDVDKHELSADKDGNPSKRSRDSQLPAKDQSLAASADQDVFSQCKDEDEQAQDQEQEPGKRHKPDQVAAEA